MSAPTVIVRADMKLPRLTDAPRPRPASVTERDIARPSTRTPISEPWQKEER